MGPEDFSALLAGILNWSRPKTANSEGAAAADAADADGAGRAFHFIQKHSREAAALGITTAAMETDEEESPVDDGGIAAAVPSLKVSTATFRSVLATYKSLLASLQAGRVPDLEALRKTTDQVVQTFAGGPKAPLPNSFHHYFDDFTFHHSTNVCLIITSLAANLSTDQELINRISIAALVHDIGKSKVPAEILHKPGKLTESEFDVLRQHPVEGAKMLLGIDGVDPLSVGVAYCHHINLDASSYPRTRKVMPLNWVTDLITVVDVYEALVSHRPYKRGLSTKTALEIMLTMPGLKNRHELIHILYHNLGPYPTGTLVELNTGERAIVVDQNLSSPFLPKVRVLTDPDRNPIDQPRDLDLSLHLPGGILNDPVKIARAVVVQSRDEDPLKADLCPEPRDILGAPLADDGALMSREG
jgi:HD-GYP domain-containing protein (c-di-GMP phosphodiesterase class II)